MKISIGTEKGKLIKHVPLQIFNPKKKHNLVKHLVNNLFTVNCLMFTMTVLIRAWISRESIRYTDYCTVNIRQRQDQDRDQGSVVTHMAGCWRICSFLYSPLLRQRHMMPVWGRLAVPKHGKNMFRFQGGEQTETYQSQPTMWPYTSFPVGSITLSAVYLIQIISNAVCVKVLQQ